jgi:citrate synthase
MADSKAATKGGLEGVVASDSAIAWIDGNKGELRYRGYLIKDLAEQSRFAETTYLLWKGELPTSAQLDAFRKRLSDNRELPPLAMEILQKIAPVQPPMDALRTVVSVLSANDVPGEVTDPEANFERGVRLVAQFPTIVAAYARLRKGQKPIAPRRDLKHAANFLYMLTGEVPAQETEQMFDTCLVLHAEHDFNASTFSARVTAATLTDMYSAICAAIGTLKGPLHGGANTEVMHMLLEIGSPDRVEAHVNDLMARGEKIMGFGHRVYKVVDPRALILKEFSRKMARVTGNSTWFEMSERVEALVKAKKSIDMNVDFYSASTYYYMGIDPELFTAIFAISRISGWVAHVLEQYANNRLIRPRSNWVGAADREYTPIAARG